MAGGVDLWLNTPRRPWEASGTSGMKVLANGGLNLSETDGWWEEAYAPDIGWAIGDGREHGEDPAWDGAEAGAVYDLLEQRVIPEFYERDNAKIPAKWVTRVRESMARLTPQYSAHRVVRQYTEDHYIPAAAAYAVRADQRGKLGGDVLAWQRKLADEWSSISFGALKVESENGVMHFEIPVHLGALDPCAVRVELFAESRNGNGLARKAMERGTEISSRTFQYAVNIEDNRPASDFTPRVIPHHPIASVPLEADQILWQK
jgi:starch phosphorylase